MSDRTPFLRAILSGQSGAREMYADWLIERGEDDEAALWWHTPWPRTEALRVFARAMFRPAGKVCLMREAVHASFYHSHFDALKVARIIEDLAGANAVALPYDHPSIEPYRMRWVIEVRRAFYRGSEPRPGAFGRDAIL